MLRNAILLPLRNVNAVTRRFYAYETYDDQEQYVPAPPRYAAKTVPSRFPKANEQENGNGYAAPPTPPRVAPLASAAPTPNAPTPLPAPVATPTSTELKPIFLEYEKSPVEGPFGEKSFDSSVMEKLNEAVNEEDVSVKPDGNIYLPEVFYRRILLNAFGVGGWCLVPTSPFTLEPAVGAAPRTLSREYALYAHGRYLSQARGSASIFQTQLGIASHSETVKSNALMRCCKDLGVSSVLWDARYVQAWKAKWAVRDPRSFKWSKRDEPAHNQPIKV